MNGGHLIDHDPYVTIRDHRWRRGRDRGPVAARVTISRHRDFCEVAVLVHRDDRGLSYAARLTGSDQWVHFRHLQPWMDPLVEELLATLGSHGRLAVLFEQARLDLERSPSLATLEPPERR